MRYDNQQMDSAESYIVIPRTIFRKDAFGKDDPFSKREAFIDLVQMASHVDADVVVSGCKYHIARGQVAVSKNYLSARWGWSYDRVRRYLAHLKDAGWCDNQVSRQSSQPITIITISDYEQYQSHQSPARPTEAPKRFSKPTIQQIADYIKEKGYAINAERFFDYYESKGWVVGKSPMKDWRAAVRQWATRDKQYRPAPPQPAPTPAPQENQVDPELRRLFTGRYNKK